MKWTRKSEFIITCGDYRIVKQKIFEQVIYSAWHGGIYLGNKDTADEAKEICEKWECKNEPMLSTKNG